MQRATARHTLAAPRASLQLCLRWAIRTSPLPPPPALPRFLRARQRPALRSTPFAAAAFRRLSFPGSGRVPLRCISLSFSPPGELSRPIEPPTDGRVLRQRCAAQKRPRARSGRPTPRSGSGAARRSCFFSSLSLSPSVPRRRLRRGRASSTSSSKSSSARLATDTSLLSAFYAFAHLGQGPRVSPSSSSLGRNERERPRVPPPRTSAIRRAPATLRPASDRSVATRVAHPARASSRIEMVSSTPLFLPPSSPSRSLRRLHPTLSPPSSEVPTSLFLSCPLSFSPPPIARRDSFFPGASLSRPARCVASFSRPLRLPAFSPPPLSSDVVRATPYLPSFLFLPSLPFPSFFLRSFPPFSGHLSLPLPLRFVFFFFASRSDPQACFFVRGPGRKTVAKARVRARHRASGPSSRPRPPPRPLAESSPGTRFEQPLLFPVAAALRPASALPDRPSLPGVGVFFLFFFFAPSATRSWISAPPPPSPVLNFVCLFQQSPIAAAPSSPLSFCTPLPVSSSSDRQARARRTRPAWPLSACRLSALPFYAAGSHSPPPRLHIDLMRPPFSPIACHLSSSEQPTAARQCVSRAREPPALGTAPPPSFRTSPRLVADPPRRPSLRGCAGPCETANVMRRAAQSDETRAWHVGARAAPAERKSGFPLVRPVAAAWVDRFGSAPQKRHHHARASSPTFGAPKAQRLEAASGFSSKRHRASSPRAKERHLRRLGRVRAFPRALAMGARASWPGWRSCLARDANASRRSSASPSLTRCEPWKHGLDPSNSRSVEGFLDRRGEFTSCVRAPLKSHAQRCLQLGVPHGRRSPPPAAARGGGRPNSYDERCSISAPFLPQPTLNGAFTAVTSRSQCERSGGGGKQGADASRGELVSSDGTREKSAASPRRPGKGREKRERSASACGGRGARAASLRRLKRGGRRSAKRIVMQWVHKRMRGRSHSRGGRVCPSDAVGRAVGAPSRSGAGGGCRGLFVCASRLSVVRGAPSRSGPHLRPAPRSTVDASRSRRDLR